jgi:uncharacterized protein (DUF2147 family)
MKSLYLTAAALLLASTAAHAGSNGISFQVGGEKVHVEQPRGCNSLNCLQITAPGLSAKSINLNNINLNGLKSKSSDDNDVATSTPAPSAPQPAPAPAAAPAQQAPAAVATTAPPAPPAPVAQPAPAPAPIAESAPVNPAPVTAPAPQAPQVAAIAPAPQAAPVAAQPAPTTPLGLWATEENKGHVRIEQCGAYLCGHADKTGEPILINMKPVDGNKWTGRIHDPDGGGNYDSTIAMKGPNVLKVQGCAFGGMFCGGQTWKRIS